MSDRSYIVVLDDLLIIFYVMYSIFVIFFLMIRRPPRSTQSRSSAASDVYKRQELINYCEFDKYATKAYSLIHNESEDKNLGDITKAVSYTHLRAHETVLDLVCRLLLEKKKKNMKEQVTHHMFMTKNKAQANKINANVDSRIHTTMILR